MAKRRRIDPGTTAAHRPRITLRLSAEAQRRLCVTCAMERIRPGDLVEALILERSRRWVVSDRGREAGEAETAV